MKKVRKIPFGKTVKNPNRIYSAILKIYSCNCTLKSMIRIFALIFAIYVFFMFFFLLDRLVHWNVDLGLISLGNQAVR